MSRPLFSLFVPLVLVLLISTSSPATAAAEAILHRPLHSLGHHAEAIGLVTEVEAPSAARCSRSAAAASRVVVESCTDDIVRSFFGIRGRDICCRTLEAVGAGCYRVVFSDSPFADIYTTILGNVCGFPGAPAPSPGA